MSSGKLGVSVNLKYNSIGVFNPLIGRTLPKTFPYPPEVPIRKVSVLPVMDGVCRVIPVATLDKSKKKWLTNPANLRPSRETDQATGVNNHPDKNKTLRRQRSEYGTLF
ncbi:hypothetical protein JTE90_023122 [Oedothorax gibbosus]|uniref:Uncharacterized protein n=1 Tax=Oedothorax gibbosus TaxID=931172 RepID=A0AAV6ULU5_9ARAC|nr:hypothetical protein JTE90_023122 [Oedothorax gibbosus]